MQNIGKVLFFDKRGYGFIVPSAQSAPVNTDTGHLYFHASQLPGARGERSISEGVLVTYDIGSYKARPCATNIQLLPDDTDETVTTVERPLNARGLTLNESVQKSLAAILVGSGHDQLS
jgi:cold shock CspA family protein